MICVYDPHATRRMRERNVGQEEVVETLRNYESELPAKKGRRNRYKVIGHRRIRVTFEHKPGDEHYIWTVTADEVNR